MSFMFSIIKATVLTLFILLMSQIPVKGKRICDHVANYTKSETVQKPIRFIAKNLDFTHKYPLKKEGSSSHRNTSAIQKEQPEDYDSDDSTL